MGTIAFPNVAQDSEQIAAQNSLQEYARAAQEKQAANLISQQAQSVQLENQKQQLQLQDQQAMTAAMKQWDGKDIGSLPDLMRQNGISAGGYLNAQQTILARKQALTQLDSTQLSNLQSHHDAALGVLNAAEQVPDEQLMQHMTDSAQQLQAQGHLQPQEAQQIVQHAQSMPPDQFRPWIDIYKKGLMGEKEQIAQVQSGAEAEQNSAKAREENATAAHQEFINSLTKNSKPTDYYQQIDAILDPNNPATGGQNRMVKAQVDGAISRGDVEGAKQFVDQAFQNVQGINKEIAVNTNPQIQAGKEAVAKQEGISRAQTEQQFAAGSNAALAKVPAHLVAPAAQAADKAGQDYAQSESVNQRLQAMMDAAKNGNVVSYQLIPEEGALQVTTSQGVHRINMAEIQNYGGGSLWQRMQGHIGKALTGESIPGSVLTDMAEMQKIQAQGAQSKYNNALKTINQTYGANFQPVPMEQTAPAAPAAKQATSKAAKWGTPIQ